MDDSLNLRSKSTLFDQIATFANRGTQHYTHRSSLVIDPIVAAPREIRQRQIVNQSSDDACSPTSPTEHRRKQPIEVVVALRRRCTGGAAVLGDSLLVPCVPSAAYARQDVTRDGA